MISVDASTAIIANESTSVPGPSNGRPMPVAGNRFVGTYHCPQGQTKLTIAVDDVTRGSNDDEMNVGARFEFLFEGDDGDEEVRGSFRMVGKYEAKTRRLVMTPNGWIAQPDGYSPVGIRGTMGRNSDTLSGTIDGPGCTTFDTKLDPATAGH